MRVVIFYRKPAYQKDYYPWQQICNNDKEAADFIESLSDDYDFLICREISLGDLYDHIED